MPPQSTIVSPRPPPLFPITVFSHHLDVCCAYTLFLLLSLVKSGTTLMGFKPTNVAFRATVLRHYTIKTIRFKPRFVSSNKINLYCLASSSCPKMEPGTNRAVLPSTSSADLNGSGTSLDIPSPSAALSHSSLCHSHSHINRAIELEALTEKLARYSVAPIFKRTNNFVGTAFNCFLDNTKFSIVVDS